MPALSVLAHCVSVRLTKSLNSSLLEKMENQIQQFMPSRDCVLLYHVVHAELNSLEVRVGALSFALCFCSVH